MRKHSSGIAPLKDNGHSILMQKTKRNTEITSMNPHPAVILEKIVQFQNQKSWKMNLLGLQMKHVILKICNILKSDTQFYPHHFNII